MDYGDGSGESFHTKLHQANFIHHYNANGKPGGYQWPVLLTVVNGYPAESYATVILSD